MLAANVQFLTYTAAGTQTFTPNVVADDGVTEPPAWNEPVEGVTCGPYAGEPPAPVVPARPTNNSSHGRILDAYEVSPGVYSGVLVIPTGAPALAAGQAAEKFRWRNPSLDVTAPQPFRLAAPPLSEANGNRFEMRRDSTLPPEKSSVGFGETLAGIEWQYTLDGTTWSLWSSYTGAFAAPQAPPAPPPTLDPLSAGQWEFVGAVFEVTTGRFTQAFRIVPGGPSFTTLEWDLSDNVWRDVVSIGTDADGATLWRLLPDTGAEHTAGYEESLVGVRVRYTTGTLTSPPSLDSKGFTAPAQAPEDPEEPGEISVELRNGMPILSLNNGVRVRISGAVPGRVTFAVSVADDKVLLSVDGVAPAKFKFLGAPVRVEPGPPQEFSLAQLEIPSGTALTPLRVAPIGGLYGRRVYFDISGIREPAEPIPVQITQAPNLTASPDWTEGAAVTITPMLFTGDGINASSRMLTRPEGSGAVSDAGPVWSVVPPGTAGIIAWSEWRVEDIDGAIITRETPERLIAAADIEIPFTWAAVPAFSYVRPSGQSPATYIATKFTRGALEGETVDAMEWSTGDGGPGGLPAESQWEPVIVDPADSDFLLMVMRDPTKRADNLTANPTFDPAAVQYDFALVRENQTSRRTNYLRFRWRRTATGPFSAPSSPVYWPTLAEAPAAPVLTSLPDREIGSGATATFDLSSFATGLGLTWSVALVSPAAAWATITQAGSLRLVEPGGLTYPNTRAVTIRIENAGGFDEETFDLTTVAGVVAEARVWRPVIYREREIWQQPADFPALYNRKYWGEMLQIPHCIERVGNFLAQGGDMNGFRYSEDGGDSWVFPESIGLRGNVIWGLFIDPDDIDRIVVSASPSGFDAGYASVGVNALYMTVNRGLTFTKRQDLSIRTDRVNVNMTTIIGLPGVGLTPTTRPLRYVEWSPVETGSPLARSDAKWWRSANGGNAWTEGPAFPSGLARASFYRLVPHPTDPNITWACTSAGLWRTLNDGGLWTRVSSGTLTGAIRDLWIDPANPARQLASMSAGGGAADGVYWTTTGMDTTPSWTHVLARTGASGADADVAAGAMSVGPEWTQGGDPYRSIYLFNDRNDTTHKNMLMQHWRTTGAPSAAKRNPKQLPAGVAAPLREWFLPIVAGAGVGNSHWQEIAGRPQSRVLPSPTDRNDVYAFGYAFGWRSENGGARWEPAVANMGGINTQAMAFDPAHPERFYMAANDVQANFSENFPLYSQEYNLPQNLATAARALVGSVLSGSACAVIPDRAQTPEIPASKRGRFILGAGNYSGDQVLYVRDIGGQWIEKLPGVVSAIPLALVSEINGNLVFAGSHRSTDAGDSWQNNLLAGRTICGVGGQDVEKVWATSNFQMIQRSTTGGNGGWSDWYGNTRQKRGVPRKPWFWLSPHDDRKAVTLSAAGDLILVEGPASGTALATVKCEMALRAEYLSRAGVTVSSLLVDAACWDPVEPRVFYALAKTFGLPMAWRGTFAADFLSVAWEDFTLNFPRTANTRSIAVHPLTRDVFASCGGGLHCIAPPGPLHPQSIWAQLPKPPSNGTAY